MSDSKLLSKLRRQIAQQNAVTYKLLIQGNEELMQYFCEKYTRFTWDDYFNSNTDLGSICIEELMMVVEEI